MSDRALLIGIDKYLYFPKQSLNGCRTDALAVKDYLTGSCGFDDRKIQTLFDAKATREAIGEHLEILLDGLERGDRVLLYTSGHGAQVASAHPLAIEPDGLDEVLCPHDFRWEDPASALRDKELNALFRVVPEGVQFIWLSDACHSGDSERGLPSFEERAGKDTAKVLVPEDRVTRKALSHIRSRAAARPRVLPGAVTENHVALIAACQPGQTATETYRYDGGRAQGAFTHNLLRALSERSPASLAALTEAVAQRLDDDEFTQTPGAYGDREIISGRFFKK